MGSFVLTPFVQGFGSACELEKSVNYVAYWQGIATGKNRPDMIFDAAHFTGYRMVYLDYEVLSKIPDKVSYSLVTLDDNSVIDAVELVGKSDAGFSDPGLGAMIPTRACCSASMGEMNVWLRLSGHSRSMA